MKLKIRYMEGSSGAYHKVVFVEDLRAWLEDDADEINKKIDRQKKETEVLWILTGKLSKVRELLASLEGVSPLSKPPKKDGERK